MKIKYKVQRLLEQQKKVEKAIESIQSKCKHSEKVMKFVYRNPLSTITSVRWVCEICEKVLGWPGDADLKSFFKK